VSTVRERFYPVVSNDEMAFLDQAFSASGR
jgi:hypothetical protein